MGRLRYFYEATFFIILLALAGCSDDVEQRETTTEVPVELNAENRFLSAPFLQMPARDSVKVVWFTSFEGRDHTLHYADENTASAETLKMSRMMEDAQSNQYTASLAARAARLAAQPAPVPGPAPPPPPAALALIKQELRQLYTNKATNIPNVIMMPEKKFNKE